MSIVLSPDCAQCCWKTTAACPDSLLITTASQLGDLTIAVDFAGRGKVGGACGGSDEYVSFSNNPATGPLATAFSFIDVWGAFRDGVWTSSTTALIYTLRTTGGPGGTTAKPRYDTLDACLVSGNLGFSVGAIACPTVLSWTVTITDDGALTIT